MKKMESLADVAQFARNFSVLVRSRGPDPKGLKMRNHAFHLHQTGSTTLSASGILLPDACLSDRPPIFDHLCSIHRHTGDFVVTTASVVEPFLTAEHRSKVTQEFLPKLIPSARIDVLVEGKEDGRSSSDSDTNPCWLSCKVLALVDVVASSVALLSLIQGESVWQQSSSWEVGWSLARDDGTQMVKSVSRIAILGVPRVELKNILHLDISQAQQKGDQLLVMGSPFGILSPLHFLNSVCIGTVSNCRASGSVQNSLLLADIRGLPGMEGGPVFDKHACLCGMLTSPLRQKTSNAEIQLIITWNAIATAWGNGVKKDSELTQQVPDEKCVNKERMLLANFTNSNHMRCLPEATDFPSFRKVMPSIALITVGDGTWASGIVLNQQGLILTNAHLLEPWRYVRKLSVGLMNKSTACPAEYNTSFSEQLENISEDESNRLFPSVSGSTTSNGVSTHGASLLNLGQKNNYGKLSVRLDNMEHQLWCDASVVYVSKGPLDVALLQLDYVPPQLCAISPEFDCLSVGLPVDVIGHGLLGPQSDIGPSVSSGVVSHVVRLPEPLHVKEFGIVSEKKSVPVMLQTTAVVHQGASGGAVINSEGRMIGLITSNAKHEGGSIIPCLNFSIPCAALAPIFRFSDEHDASVLEVLDEPNNLLSSVWALVPSHSGSPRSISERNDNGEGKGKGSRLAKFLSEKHSEFDTRMGTAHPIRDNKLPSKM